MRLADLRTPCALVDLDVLERNAARMGERMARLGVRLRPHVKTHKCVEAARIAVRGHFGGLTVSTLAEARGLADAGFRDVTWAVPIALDRLDEILALARRLGRFSVLVDSREAARVLGAAARTADARVDVFLKVDCGYHRSGVDPERPEAAALARELTDLPGLEFRGLLTHAGHSYAARDADGIRAVQAVERDVLVRFAAHLRASGVPVHEVSVGSTPTMSVAEDLTGVTEARPGNYLFHDVFQASIGSCSLGDVAFRVFATVIGRDEARGQLVVNAGALCLSKDRGATHLDEECGYGVVASPDAQRRHPALRIATLSQEHGVLHAAGPGELAPFPIGARLSILPNHSCLAAAQFDRFHVLRGGEVVDEWRPLRGW